MIKVKKSRLKLEKLKRIFHLSDIHIRNYKRHNEYNRVFKTLYFQLEKSLKYGDIICLTGDIVHSKTDVSPELFQEVQEFLRSLCEIAPVLLIPGNHDANLNNSSRMDSLTPIVNAIASDNIEYLKKTCIVELGGVHFYHWSVFDDPSKFPKPAEDDQFKIALYHGGVNNASTEIGYTIHTDAMSAADFIGFNLTLLGDIHKLQYLNDDKTIAYPGSLIQQNHGEIREHGYLVWNLEDRTSEFIKLENDTAFFTLEINSGIVPDLPQDLPKNLYLRVRYKNTSIGLVRDTVAEIRKTKNIVELSMQKVSEFSTGTSGIDTYQGIDVRDRDKQIELLKNFLEKKYSITKEDLERVIEINDTVNKSIVKSEVTRCTTWVPKRFEFDNMFSYGKGNYVDFSTMKGSYGLFAPNASGKSTLLDAITYCIFDKCSKTSRGHQVLNSSSNTFNCKLNFEMNGMDYFIERKARKQSSGNVRVEVDFYYIDAEGAKVSLNGKDRNDTNLIIKQVLGNYEDFILTTLSTQSNNTGFIDMGQRDRKDLLSQFLDIGVFEELFNIANENIKETNILLKQHKKIDYEDTINLYKTSLKDCTNQLESSEVNLKTLQGLLEAENDSIVKLATGLQKVDPSLLDAKGLNSRWEKLVSSLEDSQNTLDLLETKVLNNEEELAQLDNSLLEYNEASISKIEKELDSLVLARNECQIGIKNFETHLKHINSKLENLKELEYDPNCAYCMNNVFVKDAIKTKGDLEGVENSLATYRISYDSYQSQIDTLIGVKVTRAKYDGLKLSILNKKQELNENRLKLERAKNSHKEIKANLDSVVFAINEREKQELIITENDRIETKIAWAKEKKSKIEQSIYDLNKSITELNVKIKISETKIKELTEKIVERDKLEYDLKIYQYYLEATHRDGIPHDLISVTIPQIEDEVNNILSQLVDFRIILQTDDKNVNAYIAYDEEDFWPLELTSGMEKFISSLAIRTALISISTLPRPNFIAIDEGFGALDKNNLGAMALLFDYLKTQFKFLMIVSHIDSMRDIVDSIIEIHKTNGKSSVKY